MEPIRSILSSCLRAVDQSRLQMCSCIKLHNRLKCVWVRGCAGFSVVKRAIDKQTGDPVAIKASQADQTEKRSGSVGGLHSCVTAFRARLGIKARSRSRGLMCPARLLT